MSNNHVLPTLAGKMIQEVVGEPDEGEVTIRFTDGASLCFHGLTEDQISFMIPIWDRVSKDYVCETNIPIIAHDLSGNEGETTEKADHARLWNGNKIVWVRK